MRVSRNTNAQTLPPELLSDIFAELPFLGRLYSSHVCRHWRYSSLSSTARLWSCIASYCLAPSALLAQLERARSHPTSVYVAFLGQPEMLDETMRAITGHLYHTRILVIDTSLLDEGGSLPRAEASKIFDGLCYPAPLLETFELSLFVDLCGDDLGLSPQGESQEEPNVSDDDSDQTTARPFSGLVVPGLHVPPDLFAGVAPRLNRVLLSGDMAFSDLPYAAFENVRELVWDTTDCIYDYDLQALALSFPLLERLGLDYEEFESDAVVVSSPWTLQKLCMRSHAKSSNVSPFRMLEYLDFATIPDVNFEFWGNMTNWFRDFFIEGSNSVYSLRMHCLGPTSIGAVWTVSDVGQPGSTRVLSLHYQPFEEHGDPALWENLVRLELSERCLESLVRSYPAALPRLTELQFVFELPERGDKDKNRISILSCPWVMRAPIVQCPRLRTLEIRPRKLYSPPVVIAPEDVCDFMRLNLAFDAPELYELLIWNCDLLTLVPNQIGRLIASVTHLRTGTWCDPYSDRDSMMVKSRIDVWDPERKQRDEGLEAI